MHTKITEFSANRKCVIHICMNAYYYQKVVCEMEYPLFSISETISSTSIL